MIKKRASDAYTLAAKFLRIGQSERAKIAIVIGDRFCKLANNNQSNFIPREDRLHPAVEHAKGDIDGINKNLSLISDYIKKAKDRVSKVDTSVFNDAYGDKKTEKAHKAAIEELKNLENMQNALEQLLTARTGRKPLAANVALDHLRDAVMADADSGQLNTEDKNMLMSYLNYLQPHTGHEGKDPKTQKDYVSFTGEKI